MSNPMVLLAERLVDFVVEREGGYLCLKSGSKIGPKKSVRLVSAAYVEIHELIKYWMGVGSAVFFGKLVQIQAVVETQGGTYGGFVVHFTKKGMVGEKYSFVIVEKDIDFERKDGKQILSKENLMYLLEIQR